MNPQRHPPRLALLAAGLLIAASEARAIQTDTPADAPAPATAPATMPAGAVPLVATVTSLKGTVRVRAGEGEPWRPAKVGMQLDQGVEIQTGLRSAVQFAIGQDQTVTLDRLGTVTVLQAFQDRGRAKTDLGLRYGRARYDIRDTDLQHDSTIRSPGSTLAIRGTDVLYEDQAPWVPTAISREGRAEFRNYRRQFVAFGGTRRAAVSADKDGPAQQALSTTKVDPRGEFAGRTAEEEQLLLTLTSAGGADARGLQAIQDLARLGGFSGTFAGVAPVPGPLQFDLTWLSTASMNPGPTNLDLLVTDPLGNTATALDPVVGAGSATGLHGGDDAGPGGAGAEGVVWGLFFPPGQYAVTATHRGGDPAQVFVNVFRGQDADTVATFGVDPQPAIVLHPGESFTGTVSASGSDGARSATRGQRSREPKRARDLPAARGGKRR